jgi:catechol 2,3-dioxygenase-like lactoylglutathione lyase family enzyme
MFDHIAIRVADQAAAERFYRATLAALEIEPSHAGDDRIEWGDFRVTPAGADHPPTCHLHLAFVAPSRDHVDRFWRVGRDAGYEDEGEPGERPQYTPSYYGAFLCDPDGNSAEAVCHADVRRGGHVDHLWIRVRDLDATSAFYAALAPHAGLREGRRWEAGRQFRGAWATFSLVDDGAPPTENLHLAFPAPDRQTVEDFHRVATVAGFRDNGSPAERSRQAGRCYSACVLDPEGTSVESIFREPLTSAGGRGGGL